MIKNFLLLLGSLVVSFFLAEGLLRIALDPVDYLAVQTVPDQYLNHKIPPGESGHDEWGLRNKFVPDGVDILAIGDSMTYGVMAKSYESWPARLAEITGKSVYNAGLGGYGPLHYLHVLENRAPILNPDQVIVMIYPGNDLMDVFNLTYSNENWSRYRSKDADVELDSEVFVRTRPPVSLQKRIRSWLARNSMVYRLVTQNPLFDTIRVREKAEGSSSAFMIEHLDSNPTVLDPEESLLIANYDDQRIRESLDIVSRALDEMKSFCDRNGIKLHVALMPVKEHVFLPHLPEEVDSDKRAAMERLSASLIRVEAELIGRLEELDIPFTNLRPVLEEAWAEQDIYPPSDGHPNAKGYLIAAEAIAADIM